VVVSVALVELRNGRAKVRIAVRDTGIGIAGDQLSAIFQPFSQADLSMTRKYGGTGLGLTIAKRLVGMMGATLEVASDVGKGSEFSFTIEIPVEEGVPAPLPEPGAVSLPGLKMLVVDDNASNRRIVREMLAAVGVSMDEASHADEGLEALRRTARSGSPYALAIIDAQMPGRDGFELAGFVRADASLTATRLLMLTSAGQRGDAQRCRELGIRGYLTKPVTRADLLDTIAGVLGSADAAPGTGEVVTRHRIAESRRQLHILLAEDNPVNQEVAATMLRKRGHHVDVVGNGREAVEQAARERYDVVLMDVQMPEMDGYEATRAIRATESGRELPIVALTAHALPDERERSLSEGLSGYLSKPFRAWELFAAVEGWHGRASGAVTALPAAEPAPATPTPVTPTPTAPAPTRPAASVPVDLEQFRKEMTEAGAGEAVDVIVKSFLDNAVLRIESITQAMAKGDAAEVSKLAHAFKSSAAQLRAHRLAALLAQMEQDGKLGAMDALRERFTEFRAEAEIVVNYLKRVGGRV
jgi:two-component system sensor histidine kinase/response regulator